MLNIRSPVTFFLLLLLSFFSSHVHAAPKRGGKTAAAKGGATGATAATAQTLQQQANAQFPQGITQATDGSTILDSNVTVNGLNLRFKVSAPADQFTAAAGVAGGAQAAGTQGVNGINVLLHGDGADSFFKFPNQAVQQGLMGVAILAPSEELLWGQSKGQPQGLTRDNGAEHSLAVNDFIKTVLPEMVAFNSSNVFFTGVSGGSLTLSGFFVPAHMAAFPGGGVLLMCGALAPQVAFVDANAVASSTKIHFQSTQNELSILQQSIPEAVTAYEGLATAAGLDAAAVGALQTVDNTPVGGHCEFDEKDFSTGVQLISDNYANIMQGGDGVVQGINAPTVLTPVPGNEALKFGAAA